MTLRCRKSVDRLPPERPPGEASRPRASAACFLIRGPAGDTDETVIGQSSSARWNSLGPQAWQMTREAVWVFERAAVAAPGRGLGCAGPG